MLKGMFKATLEALTLWARSRESWLSARPAVAEALIKRFSERTVAKTLRRIGRLVDIYGDDPMAIAKILNAEMDGEMRANYTCDGLTVVRAAIPSAIGYRFGRAAVRKGRSLDGRPLLLGARLCPPPLLPDALMSLGPIDEIMPGAYEVELPCDGAGRAVVHAFASGAVTIATSNWECAYQAYRRLLELAKAYAYRLPSRDAGPGAPPSLATAQVRARGRPTQW